MERIERPVRDHERHSEGHKCVVAAEPGGHAAVLLSAVPLLTTPTSALSMPGTSTRPIGVNASHVYARCAHATAVGLWLD